MKGLCRRFRQGDQVVEAVRGVDLTLASGEIACVLGRSGSGKSTLLHLLGCLDRPDEGEIWLLGERVSHLSDGERVMVRRRVLGFVFQSFNLLSHLTAEENVALPLRYAGESVTRRLKRAREALERVGLRRRLDFRPDQMSGGEQQRVALARALVSSPPLVLADEPTGELDSTTASEIAGWFREMHRERGTTFVIATHDDDLAAVATRRLRMQDGALSEIPDVGPAGGTAGREA